MVTSVSNKCNSYFAYWRKVEWIFWQIARFKFAKKMIELSSKRMIKKMVVH